MSNEPEPIKGVREHAAAVQAANDALASVLDSRYRFRKVMDSDDALFNACQLLGQEESLTFVKPAAYNEESRISKVRQIARASGLQLRKISLEDGWWKTETLPGIGFLLPKERDGERGVPTDVPPSEREIMEHGTPVAILKQKGDRFVYVDPESGQTVRIDENTKSLSDFAFNFYRSFDNSKPINLATIARMAIRGRGADLFVILAVGVICGLIGLIPPIFMHWIVDVVIPTAEKQLLIQLTLVLISLAICGFLLNLLRSYAILRIEGSGTLNLESAVWDRLIRLESSFFRRFSTGDLVSRANGIVTIRGILSNSTLSALMSSVFCFPSMCLMVYYSLGLSLAAAALLFLCAILQTIGAFIVFRYQRLILEKEAEIQNLTFQYFSGIEKIRSSFSENFAFLHWAQGYAESTKLIYRCNLINQSFGLLSTLFNPLSLLVIYWLGMHWGGSIHYSSGTFIAFLSAYGTVNRSVLDVFGSLSSLTQIIPLWGRLRPILDTLPERSSFVAQAQNLRGGLEVSNLTFSYDPNLPPVLNDVSFRLRPGEFLAVVGESGAGKSTLLRLLLGFEKPMQGTIFYDEHDLSNMDVRSLRQQLGVVLQNGGMMNADIFSNIAGGTGCGLDEAWQAAELAGIAEDIRQMPMKMSTPISLNGGTVSGGQRQRIMIARALIASPKILFLDEATNSLDNLSQSIVANNIERLQISRIVIAHRLSTIRNADRIIVLKEGSIIQQGNFDELMESGGYFRQLVERQIA